MICHYHPHATLERIAQDIHFTNMDGDKLEHRVMLRCTCMISDKLRCPFVCAEYDSERKEKRKCYRCGAKLTSTDDSALTLKRCLACIAWQNKSYRIKQKTLRMRNAKKSGRALLAQVRHV